MSPEKLVMMANQIATFFETQPGEGQAAKVAAHINDFWEPRMRQQLAAHVAAGGEPGQQPAYVGVVGQHHRA